MNEHIPLEDLSARVDNALPPARLGLIDAHLAACDSCRAEYESLLWAVRFLRATPRAEAPKDASFHVPVVDRRPDHVPLRLTRRAIVFAGAAAALVVASFGLVGVPHLRGRLADSNASGSTASLRRAEGGTAVARLGPEVEEGAPLDAPALEIAPSDANAAASRAFGADGTPAWGVLDDVRTAEAESENSGYPVPLATARELQLRERGIVAPPPEVAALQPPLDASESETAVASERSDREPPSGAYSAPEAVGSADATNGASSAPEAVGSADASTGASSAPGATGSDDASTGAYSAPEAVGSADASTGAYSAPEAVGSAEALTEATTDAGAATPSARARVEVLRLAPTAQTDTANDATAAGASAAAETDDIVAKAVGGEVAERASGSDTAAPTRPMPWTAIVGLAFAFAALGALLISRHRRGRRRR